MSAYKASDTYAQLAAEFGCHPKTGYNTITCYATLAKELNKNLSI